MSNIANEIYQAIVKHTAWKKRLHLIVETGKKGENISAENSELGKWLKANAATLNSHPHYLSVLELQEKLHIEAQQAVALALKGKLEEARAAIEYGSEFEHLSQLLVHNIIIWHDAVTGKTTDN